MIQKVTNFTLIKTHDKIELCMNGEVLKAKFDTSGRVVGCIFECFGECSLTKCTDCSWKECPMRGGRKE
jgi:hypothetical protein